MKVSNIKTFFEDFSTFRKNRDQIRLYLKAREANLKTSQTIESSIANVRGPEFVAKPGKLWMLCECSNGNCELADFVDQEQFMDIISANPRVKFIHKDCSTIESGGWSLVLGDLGSFHVVIF